MNTSRKNGTDLGEVRRTLPLALLRAREAIVERYRPLLTQYGLTEQQWRVLRVLQDSGELDASQLAERAFILPQSLTRMLRSLEGRELIAVGRDPGDGRRMQVSLTADGAALIADVAPAGTRIYSEIEAKVGAGEIEALLARVEHLIDALKQG